MWLLLICVQISARNFTQLSNNKIFTLSPSCVEIYQKKTRMPFQPRQYNPHYSAFYRHAELAASELSWAEKHEWPKTLQIWTHWTITSGVLYGQSTINSSCSLRRSLRQLMSWKFLCSSSGKSCHNNTSTRRWQTSPSAWRPTWLWLPVSMVAT